ncbi:UNVERIFIED_ORG: hypothetical protein M2435_001436 [Rhizobium sophorae]|jgi:hypothetical protein|nr:hypothetical protein [Rhizobium leguminosarum]MDH6658537.1 hypothetical protein [Rhizobium sophorae]
MFAGGGNTRRCFGRKLTPASPRRLMQCYKFLKPLVSLANEDVSIVAAFPERIVIEFYKNSLTLRKHNGEEADR